MHGISYSRPEVLYYWVYYAGMNAPWAVIPGCEFFFVLLSFPLLFSFLFELSEKEGRVWKGDRADIEGRVDLEERGRRAAGFCGWCEGGKGEEGDVRGPG